MPAPKAPEPIKIRMYGFFTITKRGYMTLLAFSLALIAGLLAVWLFLKPNLDRVASAQALGGRPSGLDAEGKSLPPAAPVAPSPEYDIAFLLLNNIPWILLGLTALFGLEAYVMLRRFARAEAERAAEERRGRILSKY
jgi:hypothetical protein